MQMTEPTAEEKREINRRIAELRGYKVIPLVLYPGRFRLVWPDGRALGPDYRTEKEAWSGVPNYCDDLNETHRLEMGLDEGQQREYACRVQLTTGS